MGVSGLWTLVGPAARPVQLESLRNQKMAVDASIWIHQFMRTMRDKEGNALRNGHLLGFFRRLCKLLFYNIKPVFVFDGGAPALKRSTIIERRRRREGISNNLKRTAEKILSAQVKARVLAEEEKRRRGEPEVVEKEVNFDEVGKAAALENIKQKMKRDNYELPAMPAQKASADPRLATEQELVDFINEYRPSKEDIDSEAFLALPPEIQFEIVRDIGMESRKTSWARLDEMVRQSRTALDFSKQQIKLLMHRNDMTQRLLNMNERPEDGSTPTRVAGERSREYVLVKNEDVKEGLGWKLPGMDTQTQVVPVTKSESPEVHETIPDEPEDKVKDAIAGNPKLAAMFAKFDSDEEYVSDQEYPVDSASEDNVSKNDDDEPLFLQTRRRSSLVDNMQAYVEDDEDAVNEVIRRIYENESEEVEEEPQPMSPSPAPVDLDENSMYHLWLSRVPDSFLYLHSINDQHKHILHDAIFDHDIEYLETELKRVQKVYGKTSDRNEMELESLSFQARFLDDILQWKRWKNTQQVVHEPVNPSSASINEKSSLKGTVSRSPAPNDYVVDDDDELDIPLVDDSRVGVEKQRSPDPMSVEESRPSIVSVANMDDQLSKSFMSIEEEKDQPPETVTSIEEEDWAPKAAMSVEENPGQTSESSPMNENDGDQPSKAITSIEDKATMSIENEPSDSDARSREQLEEDMKAAQEMLEMDPGYNSDEEMGDVGAEESEYVRFVSDIAHKDIESVREELYQDMKELNKRQRKDMGNADDVTNQMIQDIQEMLRLFGIPYVISPMEAEAQCAELTRLSLVEGVVTDDSDVFLFGGNRIYKNMFNQQKYVECYILQDLEREMSLDRGKLIQLAFFLGSDYTDGIPGIGPVAAIELLAEFTKDTDNTISAPLKRFREWYESGHDENDFQRKFRKKHKNLDIPQDFPNPLVIEAYYQPMVDTSQEQFKWGTPQVDMLRQFLMESFSWSERKADEVLLPVIREMNKRKADGQQTNIGSFFNMHANISSAPHKRKTHKSKRVQSAINRWRGEKDSSEPRKKTRRS